MSVDDRLGWTSVLFQGITDQRLDDYVKAHPGQSAYGFCLDSSKPGWAQLRFLSKSTRDGGKMQALVGHGGCAALAHDAN